MANYAGGSVVWDLDVKTEKLKLGLSEASRQIADTAHKTGKAVKKMGENFADIGKELSIGLTAPIAAITGVGLSLVTVAGQYNSVADSFRSMTQGMGIDAKEFERSVSRATGGQIDNLTILQSATRGLSLIGKDAFNDFGEDFVKMAELSKKAARATGQDVDFMFESLVLGIARESKMILDNLGVNVDIIAAKDEYAKSLGKTRGELTQSEEKHAVLNKAMLQLEDTFGNVAISAGGFGGAWQELTTLITNARIEIGQELEPTFAELTKSLTRMSREVLPDIIRYLRSAVEWFANLSPEVQKMAIAGVAALAALGPLLLVLSTMVTSLVALANPFSLMLIALSGIGVGLVLLWRNVNKEIELFGQLFDYLEIIIRNKVEQIKNEINGKLEEIAKSFDEMFNSIKTGIKDFLKTWFGDWSEWQDNAPQAIIMTLARIHDAIWDTVRSMTATWREGLDITVGQTGQWAIEQTEAFGLFVRNTGESIREWKNQLYIDIVQGLTGIGVFINDSVRGFGTSFESFATDTVESIRVWKNQAYINIVQGLINIGVAINDWLRGLVKSPAPVEAGDQVIARTVDGMAERARKIDTLLLVSKIIAGILLGSVALIGLGFVLIGFEILKGLYNGIRAAQGWLMDRMSEVATEVMRVMSDVDWYKLGRDIITSLSSGIKDFAKTTLANSVQSAKGILDKLNPFHRDSPSLVDNIRSGVRTINKEYEKLQTPNFASFGNMFENEVIAQRPVTINNSMTVQRESDMDAFSRRLSFEAQII